MSRHRVLNPEAPVDERDRLEGLCATCLNASGCLYLTSAGEPVHLCEEFAAAETVRRPAAAFPREGDSSVRLGLCSTCDQRDACMYARVEGGVWHCEEYL